MSKSNCKKYFQPNRLIILLEIKKEVQCFKDNIHSVSIKPIFILQNTNT